MELIARVSSCEAAAAAVRAGARELLLTLPVSADAMRETLQFARGGGIRTVLDYTWACPDDDMLGRAKHLEALYSLGLDGVLVADTGNLRMARMTAPEITVDWGAPCLTLEDLRFAEAQKCNRAYISPFATENEILSLCSRSPLPLAAMVLGPLCPSGDRNRCLLDNERGPFGCRYGCHGLFGYGDHAEQHLLRTRDLCLLAHRPKLLGLGAALAAPPDPSPETVDFFVRVCRKVLLEEEHFDRREMREAMMALGRPDVTDAPFTGKADIFSGDFTPGTKKESFWEAKKLAAASEPPQNTVPVRFFALINEGVPARLAVDDYKGHTLYISGPVPAPSEDPMREAEANTQWYKAGGMYRCEEARTRVAPGVRLSMVDMARMRAEALRQLTMTRSVPPERKRGDYSRGMVLLPRADIPVVTVRVSYMTQITPELLSILPERVYIPLRELCLDPDKTKKLPESTTVPVVILPRVVREEEKLEVMSQLKMLFGYGYREALVHTPGQMAMAAEAGYSIRADWMAADSQSLKAAKAMGIVSCTLAPWLTFADIQNLCHVVDTEMLGYGRMPLLHLQACAIKPKSGLCACDNHNEIVDETGGHLPLLREDGHSNMLFHSQKLWLGEVERYWKHIGLWAVRLDFTTENPRECVQVTQGYMHKEPYKPHTHTTGFYTSGLQNVKSPRKK